jgi:hypothetical protein
MNVVIPSRTWEGSPRRCPVCRQVSRVEPSWPSGDAPCPACGHLLWPRDNAFLAVPRATALTASRRAGRAVRRAWETLVRAKARVRKAIRAGKKPRRDPETASSGVWDAWVDG